MKILFTLTFCLAFSMGFAQNSVENRKAFTFKIPADDKLYYQMEVEESPYFIKDKVLQIYCNEKVFVECEVAADTIRSMKVVKENLNPNRTIIIDFNQNGDDKKSIRTNLNVKNPFDRTLLYEAMMYTPLSPEWEETSIIPIRPKLQNFEMWPHAIITLILDNWKFK